MSYLSKAKVYYATIPLSIGMVNLNMDVITDYRIKLYENKNPVNPFKRFVVVMTDQNNVVWYAKSTENETLDFAYAKFFVKPSIARRARTILQKRNPNSTCKIIELNIDISAGKELKE